MEATLITVIVLDLFEYLFRLMPTLTLTPALIGGADSSSVCTIIGSMCQMVVKAPNITFTLSMKLTSHILSLYEAY